MKSISTVLHKLVLGKDKSNIYLNLQQLDLNRQRLKYSKFSVVTTSLRLDLILARKKLENKSNFN